MACCLDLGQTADYSATCQTIGKPSTTCRLATKERRRRRRRNRDVFPFDIDGGILVFMFSAL
jgi:hypothetical protein